MPRCTRRHDYLRVLCCTNIIEHLFIRQDARRRAYAHDMPPLRHKHATTTNTLWLCSPKHKTRYFHADDNIYLRAFINVDVIRHAMPKQVRRLCKMPRRTKDASRRPRIDKDKDAATYFADDDVYFDVCLQRCRHYTSHAADTPAQRRRHDDAASAMTTTCRGNIRAFVYYAKNDAASRLFALRALIPYAEATYYFRGAAFDARTEDAQPTPQRLRAARRRRADAKHADACRGVDDEDEAMSKIRYDAPRRAF